MVFRTGFFVLLSGSLVLSVLGIADPRFLGLVWPYTGFVLLLAGVSYLTAPDGRELRIERRMDRVLSVGVENLVRLSVTNESDRTIRCTLREEPPPGFRFDRREFEVELAPGRAVELRYHVIPSERGDFFFRDTFYRASGWLRLVFRQQALKTRQVVRVYPNVLALRKFDLLNQRGHLREIGIRRSRLRSLGTDFESLREYVPDDDYRRIDWKATARRGTLIVREYEAERNQSVVLIVDYGRLMMADAGGRKKLDHVLDASLLLANAVIHANDQLGLLVYGDRVERWIPPKKGRGQLGEVIEAVHDLQAEPIASDAYSAFAYLSSRWKRRSLIVVFTEVDQPEVAKQLLSILGPLARHHVCLVVTVADPNTRRLMESSDPFLSTAARLVEEDRERASWYLRQSGVRTLDAEPEALAAALVNCYLDIKAAAVL
ncbi:MAG: DUF58 domain-containing protein [Armatimonadetes bacterium]|nr:MAG: DUF58 domain-containing protein [Armatimonadota bacterium]